MEQEPEGDDIIAAEYVLGVQTAEERREIARRVETDRVFARLVDDWERRFASLSASVAEVTPPSSVKRRIDAGLFDSSDGVRASAGGFWDSVAFWRTIAIASLAGLVAFVVTPFVTATNPQGSHRMVASLAAEGSDVHYMALVDDNEIGLSHMSGLPAQGQVFELWIIKGQNAPESLGVVPVGETVRIELPRTVVEAMKRGDTFALSLEPTGGSPTGQPTGPVVAAGGLIGI